VEEQEEILKETWEFVNKMRRAAKTKKIPALLPFQVGVLRNCVALPMLYADLLAAYPDKDIRIPTASLNQDVLESYFSVIRSIGATNTAPSPLEFKFRLRKTLVMRRTDVILRDASGNVSPSKELSTLSAEVKILFEFISSKINQSKQIYLNYRLQLPLLI
jgi:hypothetical protein